MSKKNFLTESGRWYFNKIWDLEPFKIKGIIILRNNLIDLTSLENRSFKFVLTFSFGYAPGCHYLISNLAMSFKNSVIEALYM